MSRTPVELLKRAQVGDEEAISELLQMHRARLAKMVRTRLNPLIRGRVDELDIIQESYLEAVKRLPDYLADPQAPFFLWLRKITGYKIIDVHRRHLGGAKRNAERELSINRVGLPMATSVCLAANLVGSLTTPSQAVIKLETQLAIQNAMEDLNPVDREILSLRHFEELTNLEAAEELGIEPAAASKRFVRSLQRLQKVLEDCGLVNADP